MGVTLVESLGETTADVIMDQFRQGMENFFPSASDPNSVFRAIFY